MRTDLSQERWFARGLGLAAFAGGAGLGAALGGPQGAIVGGLGGMGTAYALDERVARRTARRQRAIAGPFPEPWRDILRDTYDHYDRLPAEWRARFETDVRIFVAEKRVTGVEVPVSDEMRLLVAASAVTLSLGWPEFEWDVLAEVLLYPQNFDRDYSFDSPDLAGQAHPWGSIILSTPSLIHSFDDPDDGFHVGLHEFAHLLDGDRSGFHGLPPGMDPKRRRDWVEVMEQEMERLRRGRSVIDDYGAHEPAEFFAVAVEAFFESALALRDEHGRLYALLSEYFRQDPAAWDDARGITLE